MEVSGTPLESETGRESQAMTECSRTSKVRHETALAYRKDPAEGKRAAMGALCRNAYLDANWVCT